MDKKIIITEDGSNTIFVPSLNEHYHSTHGAVQESMHVFIKSGLREIEKTKINIFEVGFGTGLNAFLTAIESENLKIEVNYTSIEKHPLNRIIIQSLNYPEFFSPDKRKLFSKIHDCAWNHREVITDNFNIKKIEGDIKEYCFDDYYDLIYFDAFGPDKQAEMWTNEIINNIASSCKRGCLFLTYSSRGQLKRQLRANNFAVDHIAGPPGKREITRAIKL